jgi:DNA-binding response OmpR family regulator
MTRKAAVVARPTIRGGYHLAVHRVSFRSRSPSIHPTAAPWRHEGLHSRRVRTPILMLAALDAVEERVRGLDVGADDYLVKPFALSELLARLRALSRRHLDDRSAILRAGALELDTFKRRVTVDGLAVGLTMKEFSILELLLLHPGQLISRTQIEEHVWNYDFAGESNLVEVYIGRLRRKLAAVGMGDPIETVRHGGYRLEARAPSATPSGAPEPG